MKKTIFFFLILVISWKTQAQQIVIETGEVISSFNYKNANNEILENLQPSHYSYYNLSYRSKFFVRNLYATAGVSYNSYGAIGSDRALNNFMEWDLSTVGISAGLDYEFLQQESFRLYVKGNVSSEFLIRGNQTLKHQVYDLATETNFSKSMLFLKGGLGMSLKISDNAALTVQYMLGSSLVLTEKVPNTTETEKLSIATQHFGLGIVIDVSKFNRECNW